MEMLELTPLFKNRKLIKLLFTGEMLCRLRLLS